MTPEEMYQRMMHNMMGGMMPPPPYGGWPQPPYVPAWMQWRPYDHELAQATPEFPYGMGHEGGTGNGRAATRKSGELV